MVTNRFIGRGTGLYQGWLNHQEDGYLHNYVYPVSFPASATSLSSLSFLLFVPPVFFFFFFFFFSFFLLFVVLFMDAQSDDLSVRMDLIRYSDNATFHIKFKEGKLCEWWNW